MIDGQTIREIFSQYEKFGWRLEHVRLSNELKSSLAGRDEELFSRVTVAESDLDAAWFSRMNANGRVAWELRSLGHTSFALVDSAEPNASESDLNQLFQRLENQMRQRLIRPREK